MNHLLALCLTILAYAAPPEPCGVLHVADLAPPAYAPLVVQAAEAHGIPPRVLAALVQVESSWRPDAEGSAGERGLVQILPPTARWIAEVRGLPPLDLSDPWTALDAGAWYLALHIRAARGDVEEALRRYNGGPRWRDRAPQMARGYSRRVLAMAGG